MIEFLPMFPLQLVVFPKEKLNLHIFEPRYLQMMNEAEENDTTFGVSAFIDQKVQPIGTELRIVKVVKRYANGRIDVRTEGIRTFEIRDFFEVAPDKLYAAAQVEMREEQTNGDLLINQKILTLILRLYDYLNIKKEIPKTAREFSTFKMGHHVGFSLEQEYQMLTLRSEVERQEFMLRHLENLLPIVKEMEELRRRVQMNGHFKNILPPNFKK